MDAASFIMGASVASIVWISIGVFMTRRGGDSGDV